MADKIFPFTKQDILNEIKNSGSATFDFGECNHGCGRNATHAYFYVTIGWTHFTDGGKYSRLETFVKVVQDHLNSMKAELEKENIFFKTKKGNIYCGRDYWGCPRYEDIEYICSCVKLTPTNEFLEIQKWLKKKANFDLKITDLYVCQVCQKRSSKSYNDYHYVAEYTRYITKMLNWLNENFKQGNVVNTEIIENEEIDCYDRNRYEYEQYGVKQRYLKITITTPSGRKPRIFDMNLI